MAEVRTPRGSTRILALTESDLDAHRRAASEGAHGDALPYGMQELESLGYLIRGGRRRDWPARLRSPIEGRLGAKVEEPLTWSSTARGADIILAVLDQYVPAAAALTHLPGSGYWRKPLVSLVCWAAETLRHGTQRQKSLLLPGLRGSDIVAFWSRNQRDIFIDAGLSPEQLVPLTFGVCAHYFTPPAEAPERDIAVLAVGEDIGRDYRTLAAAAAQAATTVDIIGSPSSLVGVDAGAHVRIHERVSYPAYRDLLQRAETVVVPTYDFAYPTGQTVALEAAAAGCAVVVSGTAAMNEYFTDNETALMPRSGDVGQLAESLREVTTNESLRQRIAVAGQRRVNERYTTDVMWHELDSAFAERGWAH